MAPLDDVEIVDMTSSPPRSPSSPSKGKRKAEDTSTNGQNPDKKPKTSLIELKPRKVVFSQEPYQRNVPRRRLLNFEAWLLDAEEAGNKPTSIPDEFYDVIVMAGHELTSSTENAFLKSLKSELVKGSTELLTNEILAPVVSKLFTLKQYGFLPTDFGIAASKLPAGLQIRCWEANNASQYFPEDQLAVLKARRSEREHAREECERLLAGLDEAGKTALLKGEKIAPKLVAELDSKPAEIAKEQEDIVMKTPLSSPAKAGPSSARRSREGTACSDSSRRSVSPSKKGKVVSPEEEEASKKRKEEREAKRIEREEKKKEKEEKLAAKEREEQKKAEVKAKQAKMFGAFFGKAKEPASPKATVPLASCSIDPAAGPSSPRPNSVTRESDFRRAFKPPPQRANVEWAPINRWQDVLREPDPSIDVSMMTPRQLLDDHLQRHRLTRRGRRAAHTPGLKTAPVHGTVADKWQAYQEAEDPRAVLDELRDSSKFPWKTLAFDQQSRPPYCGTFTKRSVVVGPRTPFSQDPIFDYSYDSGDEWQEDEGGDDVDDFGEVAEEPELASDEEEGEFDDWLDDEDENVLEVEPIIDMTSTVNSPKPVKKRLVPKRVTKVTPTWHGPVWESPLGSTGDVFEDYRVQLLNDTPSTFDPFKYESHEPLQHLTPVYTTMAIGLQTGIRTLTGVDLEKPVNKPPPAPMPLGDASSSANQAPVPKKRIQPKVAFPSSHLPELLKIVDGNTKIFTDLTSTLREKFDKVATKAAIEAKIREVATREGRTKDSAWRVKAEAWSEAGVNPPPRAVTSLASNGV